MGNIRDVLQHSQYGRVERSEQMGDILVGAIDRQGILYQIVGAGIGIQMII